MNAITFANEQIQQWAREAEFDVYDDRSIQVLQAFATLVRNATLEEAAVKCEQESEGWVAYIEGAEACEDCAKEIMTKQIETIMAWAMRRAGSDELFSSGFALKQALEAALNSNESAYQRGYMDGRAKPVEAALGQPQAVPASNGDQPGLVSTSSHGITGVNNAK